MSTRTVQTYDSQGNLVATRTEEVSIEQDNAALIIQQAIQAMATNSTFIAATKPTTTTAQASAAYDAGVRHARQMNGVIRFMLGLFDSVG